MNNKHIIPILTLILTTVIQCNKSSEACNTPNPGNKCQGEQAVLGILYAAEEATDTKCNPCKLITVSGGNGSFPNGTGTTGIERADNLCLAAGNYKAVLVDGANRIASVTANTGDGQVDWVLHPDTTYKRSDGTEIGTTDAKGLLNTFTNPVAASTLNVWTGLATGWVTSANTCSQWSDGTSTFNGVYKNIAAASIAGGIASGCSLSIHIICAEQ